MQDGASCHTANIIKDYLAFVGLEYIKDYPGNSPDISPIENLWAIMKAKLKEREIHRPKVNRRDPRNME